MSFNTPILFLIFNRPDVTYKVFERIREIKPNKLFVAADGPRKDKIGESDLCEKTRGIVNEIDWECNVETLFRNENKGCGLAVSEAISWFFNSVEWGIILEDDTLPSISFFPYCEELLEKYKNNNKITAISGTNFLRPNYNNKNRNESYFFSEYVGCWGWASWKRAWEGYDYAISSWRSVKVKNTFKKRFKKEQFLFLSEIFDSVCINNTANTWDYQWWYQRLHKKSLGIIPTVNLIRNIGFSSDATHTFDANDEIKNAVIENIHFPILHPLSIEVNAEFDLILSKKQFWKEDESLIKIIKRKLRPIKNKFSSSKSNS